MIALFLIAFFCLFCFIAWKLTRLLTSRFESLWIRLGLYALSFFLFAGLLFGDQIIGKINFDRRCAAEAGLKIYKTVQNVEGYASNSSDPKTALIDTHYVFLELKKYDGFHRYSLSPSGEIIDTPIDRYTARYSFEITQNIPDNSNLNRSEYVVSDRQTGETLGRYTKFYYFGGWVRHMLPPSPYVCPASTERAGFSFWHDALPKILITNQTGTK